MLNIILVFHAYGLYLSPFPLVSTIKGPISCVAPYPTEEHPGPENEASCHLSREHKMKVSIKAVDFDHFGLVKGGKILKKNDSHSAEELLYVLSYCYYDDLSM